jgi:hypothetical protein
MEASTAPAAVDYPTALDEATPRKLWGWTIAIALLGIGARAAWYFNFKDAMAMQPWPVGAQFQQQALAFLDGALANPSATLTSSFPPESLPPGYGVFLAGLWSLAPRPTVATASENSYLAVYAVQWVLVGLTTLLTFSLSRRVLFGYAALIPAVLLNLSVALLDLPNMLANETLLMFLLTLTIWLLGLVHDHPIPRNLLISMLAGLTLGAAVLVQPRVGIALPFMAWWMIRGANWEHAVVFLAVAAMLPGAWVAHQYSEFNSFVPISTGAYSSIHSDNVNPIGGTGSLPGSMSVHCNQLDRSALDPATRIRWTECQRDAGFDAIADNPSRSARAVADRFYALLSSWNPDQARGVYSATQGGYQDALPHTVRTDPKYANSYDIATAVFVGAYLLLVLAGIYALWIEGAGSASRLLAIPLITLPLALLVYHAENRFRVPVLPLLMISLTLGATALREAIARK